MKIAKRILLYGIPKSLLIKIILALVIFLIGQNVFALDYNVTSSITSPSSSGTSGTYSGTEISYTGTQLVYHVNTRNDGTLSRIVYNLPLPSDWQDGSCFATNNTYTITMNMATNDWRNHFGSVSVKPYSSYSGNWSNGKVTYVSKQKIYFTFTIPTSYTSCVDFVYVDLQSSSISTTAFTGETNWNLSKITLTDPMYNSGGGGSSSGGSSSGGSSTPSNQDVINNATNNTQDIINNNDNNTQNIIDNNNQNTQDIINNQNENATCPIGPHVFTYDDVSTTKKSYLTSSGSIVSPSSLGISTYLVVKSNTEYTLKTEGGYLAPSLCFYRSDKELISCFSYNQRTSITFTTPNRTSYIRLSIPTDETITLTGPVCNNFEKEAIDSGFNGLNGAVEGASSGIINNQNENTNKTIDSQKVCTYIDKNYVIQENAVMNLGNGEVVLNQPGWGVTDYIKLGSSLTVVEAQATAQRICYYNINKNFISCEPLLNYPSNSIVNVPTNAAYFRSTISLSSGHPTFNLCTSGNQALNDNINDLNDSINNSNVDSGTGSNFFNDFHTDDNGGISAIITKPLMLINSLLSNNDSCSNLPLPDFMGVSNVSLPSGCILWNNASSLVINLWNIFVCGFASYYILKDLFKVIENIKNPDNDRVEVLDL